MSSKRKAWAKVRHNLWSDERGLELSGIALALRVALTVWVIEDPTQRVGGVEVPGAGWLLTEDGDAYTLRRIARLTRFDEAAVRDALAELGEARIAVRSDTGAWGLIGWASSQEDPSAQRVRDYRERQRAGNGGETPPPGNGSADETDPGRYSNAAETAEERGERRDVISPAAAGARADTPIRPPGSWSTLGERIRITRVQLALGETKLSERTGIPAATIRAFERDQATPTRAEARVLARELGDPSLADVELPDLDETVAGAVVAVEAQVREALGLDPIPRQPGDPDVVRLVHAPREGPAAMANWATCLRRLAEECRRQLESHGVSSSAEFLRLEYLAKPRHRERYLAAADLDQRRERAPPSRRSRGPLPPQNAGLKPEVPRG